MSAKVTIEQMLAQRRRWKELVPNGKRVQIQRPAEAQMGLFRERVSVETLATFVVGWDKFTGVDLLGEGVGSGDAVPFDHELFVTYLNDNIQFVAPITEAIAEAITEHLARKGVITKN
jgi:hypothetical protein